MLTITQNMHKNSQHTMKWPLLMACLTTSLLLNQASAQTFYKWVDKAGSTHYTQTPPPGSLARKAKTIQVDDAIPAQNYNNNSSETNPSTTQNGDSNNTASGLNSNQLAQAANSGSIPNTQPNMSQSSSAQPTAQNNAQPSNNRAPNTPPPQRITPPPALQSITPPPANRLIQPSQNQIRPAFSDREL